MTLSQTRARLLTNMLAGVLPAMVVLGACSSTDSGITDPGSTFTTIQVNASTSTAYVTLGTPATVATVSDPATSTSWDLAFTPSPSVSVNGGASGPGTSRAYCLCQNTALPLTQVEALSATQGADAFGAVTSANIPSDASFQADAASQAIAGWYDYNATTHAITTNSKAWGVRLASTSGAYAKFHVTSIPTPG